MNKLILFVEDGSVDVEELKKTLPEVPVIIYRQGSIKPEFKEVDTTIVINRTNNTPIEIRNAIFNTFIELSDKCFLPVADEFQHRYIITDENIRDFMDKVMEKLNGADNVGNN